jgi:hypothetical protein
VVGLEKALEPDAPLVHDDLDSNLAAHLAQKKGDYAAAREKADLIVKRRIVIDRGTAAAMENRGIVAQWEKPAIDPVGHDSGPHSHPQWSGRDVRPVHAPGAGDRPLCRRRIWSQDHDVLPGGGRPHLGHSEAGPAHQVDRRPAGPL